MPAVGCIFRATPSLVVPGMLDRRKLQLLVGETLREVGILVAVFVPLDSLFQPGQPSPLVLASGMGCGLLFIATGIIIEAEV